MADALSEQKKYLTPSLERALDILLTYRRALLWSAQTRKALVRRGLATESGTPRFLCITEDGEAYARYLRDRQNKV